MSCSAETRRVVPGNKLCRGKTINRCTSLRTVLPVPWPPRSNRRGCSVTWTALPKRNHLSFLLNDPTNAPATNATARLFDSRQLVFIKPVTCFLPFARFFRFYFYFFFVFFLFLFFFLFLYRRALCPTAKIWRAQRWISWPTGTDWRCEPRSSRPRATSQWPTEDLDRARPPPPSSLPSSSFLYARCQSQTGPPSLAPTMPPSGASSPCSFLALLFPLSFSLFPPRYSSRDLPAQVKDTREISRHTLPLYRVSFGKFRMFR